MTEPKRIGTKVSPLLIGLVIAGSANAADSTKEDADSHLAPVAPIEHSSSSQRNCLSLPGANTANNPRVESRANRVGTALRKMFHKDRRDEEIDFNIPAGPIEDTLNLFGQQARISLFSDPRGVRGFCTRAVKGKLSIANAFKLLLKDTFPPGTIPKLIWVDERTAVIKGTRHYNLAAGDARIQLNEFSRQADVQVLYDFAKLQGLETPRLSGNFILSDALERLLEGLPLKYSWVNNNTISVTRSEITAEQRARQLTKHW